MVHHPVGDANELRCWNPTIDLPTLAGGVGMATLPSTRLPELSWYRLVSTCLTQTGQNNLPTLAGGVGMATLPSTRLPELSWYRLVSTCLTQTGQNNLPTLAGGVGMATLPSTRLPELSWYRLVSTCLTYPHWREGWGWPHYRVPDYRNCLGIGWSARVSHRLVRITYPHWREG